MKNFFLLCLTLISINNIFAGSSSFVDTFLNSPISFPKRNGVYHLTDLTFNECVNNFEYVLVKFYTEWCSHCKQIEPEYAAAAQSFEMPQTGLVLAELNADVYYNFAKQFEIYGFPTIILFKRGKKEMVYNKPMTKDSFIQWAIKTLVTPVVKIDSIDDITLEFEHQLPEPSLIYFGTNDNYIDILSKYSIDNFEYKIGVCKFESVAKQYKTTMDTIHVFRYTDNKRTEINHPNITKEYIDDILYEKGEAQLINDFEFVRDSTFKLKKPVAVCIRDDDYFVTRDVDPIFAKVAEKFTGKIKFIIDNLEKILTKRITSHLGIKLSKDKPVVFILANEMDLFGYVFEDVYNEKNLEEFVSNYLNGRLQPNLKSEEIPETQNGPVYKLVANNFQKEAIDTDLNVLVKFYREGCPHCIKLEPDYKTVATHFKNDEDLRVAEMDVIKNTNKWVEVKGVPTIYLFPSGDKDHPILYTGDRTPQDIQKFVKRNMKPIKPKKVYYTDYNGEKVKVIETNEKIVMTNVL